LIDLRITFDVIMRKVFFMFLIALLSGSAMAQKAKWPKADKMQAYRELDRKFVKNPEDRLIMPDMVMRGVNDERLSMLDLVGDVVLIDFWATWCGPCLQQMPHSKTLSESFKNENFKILYISVDDTKQPWLRYLAQKSKANELQLHTWFEGGFNNPTMRFHSISAIPRYILLDKQGRIAWYHSPRPSQKDYLIPAIQMLLQEPDLSGL
jgi:thiol-disulfide isomerase/thioredoxin